MFKRSKLVKVVSLVLVLMQVAGCANSPIRNPLKSSPKVVLGPLPTLEEPSSQQAKVMWLQKTTRGASYFAKIRPAVSQNIVYQADYTGMLVAINEQSGSKLWRKVTHYPIASGPVVLGDTLYVGTKNGKVVAFNAKTGDELWHTKVPSEVLAPPKGNGKVVLVSTIDGQLTALDAQDGHQLWQFESSSPSLILHGGSSPSLNQDRALAGFANGKFVALNANNGNLEWEKTITAPRGRTELTRMVDIQSNPLVIGKDVYVASYQGDITAINLETGELQWQRQISSYKDMAADKNTLYITDNDYQIWALDREHGSTLWKQSQLERRIITGPALAGDYLVVGDHGGYVHWLRKKDGQLLGRYNIGRRILQNPVTDENLVFVTAADGEMTALMLEPLREEGV